MMQLITYSLFLVQCRITDRELSGVRVKWLTKQRLTRNTTKIGSNEAFD